MFHLIGQFAMLEVVVGGPVAAVLLHRIRRADRIQQERRLAMLRHPSNHGNRHLTIVRSNTDRSLNQ